MIDCTCKGDTADLKEFAPMVLERFPTAPLAMMETHLRDSAIEFCQKSKWLQREVTVCTEGLRDFPILVDANEVLVNVSQVLLDGIPLTPSRDTNPKRAADCCHMYYGREGEYWVEALDTPDASLHIDVQECHCDQKLTIRYSVAPSIEACKVDRRLLTEAKRIIAYGALMSLTDDTKSMLYERRFREGILSFRARRLSGRSGSHGHFKPIETGV